jgi:hypothetical protein
MGVGILTDINGTVPQRAIRYLETMPYYVTYHLSEDVTTIPGVDFGAGDEAFVLATPGTFRGKPIAVDIYKITETFNSVTTQARVDIGDGTDQDEFALTDDFNDNASTAPIHFSVSDGTLNVGDTEIIQPADVVTVTCVAPTGGTPAGRAMVGVTMLYFK